MWKDLKKLEKLGRNPYLSILTPIFFADRHICKQYFSCFLQSIPHYKRSQIIVLDEINFLSHQKANGMVVGSSIRLSLNSPALYTDFWTRFFFYFFGKFLQTCKKRSTYLCKVPIWYLRSNSSQMSTFNFWHFWCN